ncbi:MAG TPA: arylamine N-acetyltransferase [Xanthobacteraceae bacterium]
MIDLDAYFRRIGFAGSAAPDRDTLDAILRLHPQAIAFENLDPLLKVPVRLDAASLESKLVRCARGGYCYEQNLLLMHVLRALGFVVRGLGARVLWGVAEGVITARAHMLLCVDLEDTCYIADVGFGGSTPTAPIRLDHDGEQPTAHEPFRVVRAGGDFVLQAAVGGSWQSLYRFDLQEQFQADYEVVNWYQSTNPNSFFATNLMAARALPGRRYGLRNNELSVHHQGGPSERRVLRTASELRDTLGGTFGLTLAGASGLEALLARLTAVAA